MKRSLFSPVALAALITLSAGCWVEVDPGPIVSAPVSHRPGADLEVSWTIGGALGPGICSYYGIDHFLVEARGPDTRDVVVDCAAAWTTGSGLYLLLEGSYSLTLRAFDWRGLQIATQQTSLDLRANGLITEVAFTFLAWDF